MQKKPHPRRFRFIVEEMLCDLRAGALEVVLIPAPDARHTSHMVRAVAGQNAAWYQKFCDQFQARRRRPRRSRTKSDTRIKRRDTLRALAELARGECRSEYAQRLYDFICSEHRVRCSALATGKASHAHKKAAPAVAKSVVPQLRAVVCVREHRA